MTRVCSGCGLHSCDGRCFDECAADYPESEQTTSRLTLDDLRKIYHSPERIVAVRKQRRAA